MYKLKNLTDLSDAEIEFLTGKNSIPYFHDIDSRHTNVIPIIQSKDVSSFDNLNILGVHTGVEGCAFTSKCRQIQWKEIQEETMAYEHTVCSNCQTKDSIIKDQIGGMIVCSNCGHVIESFVFDHSPEWKNYEDSSASSKRCGLPTNTLLPQSSLGTTIGGNCNYRLKTLHNWGLMPYKERSLNTVLNNIKSKCEAAGLLSCIEDDAKILYKIASEYKSGTKKNNIIIRGKNRTGLIAACIFYACKRRGYTKSLKEIAKLFGMKPSCVNKGCKNFIRYVKYKNIDYNTNLSHPSQYINQFCAKLKMNKKYTNITLKISTNVQKMNIVPTHTPISVAAACILLCATEHSLKYIDKHLISSIFSISEVTLMKAYNQIYKFKNVLMNNNTVDKLVDKSEINITNIVIPENLIKRLETIKSIDITKFNNVIEIKLYKYMSTNLSHHIIDTYNMCMSYNNERNNIIDSIWKAYLNI